MKEIKYVSRGQVWKIIVDDEDFQQLSTCTFSTQVNGQVIVNDTINRTTLGAYLIGFQPGCRVDHIDRNKLNNQRENLRFVTHSGNMQNRGKQRNNTLGYVGILFDKRTGKYVGQLKLHSKYHRGPQRLTKEEAAIDYNNFVIEFNTLNPLNEIQF